MQRSRVYSGLISPILGLSLGLGFSLVLILGLGCVNALWAQEENTPAAAVPAQEANSDQTDADTKAKMDAGAKTETEAETKAELGTDAKAEGEGETKPETDAKPEEKTDAKTEKNTEGKKDTDAQRETEAEIEAKLSPEARMARSETESAAAAEALETLKKAPAPVSVEEWSTERGYPWKKDPAAIVALPADEQLQELVLMRVFATLMDHLNRITQTCDRILEVGNSSENPNIEFVRKLFESAAVQQADVILGKAVDLPNEKLREAASLLKQQVGKLRRVLTWNPNSAEANLFLTEMLALSCRAESDPQKIEAMVAEMRQCLDKGLEFAEAQEVSSKLQSLALARRAMFRPNEELDQAIADLDLAEKLDPSQDDVLRGKKLVLYVQNNKLDNAMELLNAQIQDLREKQKQAEAEDDKELSLGIQEQLKRMYQLKVSMYVEMKKLDDALALIRELREKEPENTDLMVAELDLLYKMGKKQECIKLLEKLIEENPFNSNFMVLRARLLLSEDEFAKALEDVEKALLIMPSDKDAEAIRRYCMVKLGRGEEAVAELKKKLKEKPKDFSSNLALVELLIELKQYKEVETLLNELKQKFQLDSLCETLAKQTPPLPDEDLPGLDEDETPSRSDVTEYYRNVGYFFMMAGKHREAIDGYKNALMLDPNEAVVCNNLAWVLATSPEDSLRDGKLALEWATKACEMTNYQDPGHLSTLAAAYAENGDFEKAMEWISKALELAKDDPKQTESLGKEKASYEAKKPTREREEEFKID